MNPFKAAYRYYKMRSDWLGEGGQPVPAEQSQARANVCLAPCPMNQPHGIREFFTESVALWLSKQIELKNNMKLSVRGEDDLHICDGCGCALILKIHVPLKHILDTTDLDPLAPQCWIRSEAKSQ